MSTTGARATGGTGRGAAAHDVDGGRTPAQLYCLLGGLALLLAGILGFLVEPSFSTDPLKEDKLLLFDVNGWHNVVHVLSGLVLIGAASKWRTAKTVAIAFGVVYGLVAIIGLIDGKDILGFIPINPADNILHILLAALGIIAGVISRPKGADARA